MTMYRTLKLYLLAAAFVCSATLLISCQGEPKLSGSEQVKAFEMAGPISPKVDLDQLLTAKSNYGAYTVGIGDVLELQMPTILTAISPKLYDDAQYKQQLIQPYLCRVSDEGKITLPLLGQIDADGKTLAQIEKEVVDAYYPKYVVSLPSVVCNVKEYYLKNVTIVGAVAQPGIYKLQSNELSLVNALMKAGGIIESGASAITIKNPRRKYATSGQITNEVKQLAELGTANNETYIEDSEPANDESGDTAKDKTLDTAGDKTDFSNLEFDLAFRPENGNTTQGTLFVQQGAKTVYSKNIDIKNPDQRAEYTKELQDVIGDKQAYIVGLAIEQLGGQFSSAIAASDTKQRDTEEMELLTTTDETNRQTVKHPEIKKQKTYPDSPAPASSVAAKNEKSIETPSENKLESDTANNINNVKFIEPVGEKQPAPAVAPTTFTDTIVLPVKGLNIPFADVPLMEGDLIEVKKLNPAVFTVIGLAKAPGAFPYLPDAEYNLMQAIGFAGGIDILADPRFVTIYRQDASGEIVSAVFRIDKDFMAKSCNVKIKPGDVISIDITPRTRRNVILNQMLRINFGVFVNPLSTLK